MSTVEDDCHNLPASLDQSSASLTTVDTKNNMVTNFHKWLKSLKLEDLHGAMEIALHTQSDGKERRQNKSQVQIQPQGNCDNVESNLLSLSDTDYNLMRHMIKMLPCPPTPIHPKATGLCQTATTHCVNDGRDPELLKSVYQQKRPRLFKWIDHESTSGNQKLTCMILNSDMPNLQKPKRLRSNNGKKKMTGTSFQTSASASPRNVLRTAAGEKFDVIARKFVMDDGERLSLGCTIEQQQADAAILNGTFFTYSLSSASKPNRLAFQMPDVYRSSHTGKVIRILQVASRGNFGRYPPNEMTDNHANHIQANDIKCTNVSRRIEDKHTQKKILSSQWFDPLDRWFSLPMYLAHCFELSLWHSFFVYSMSNQKPIHGQSRKDDYDETTRIVGEEKMKLLLYKAVNQSVIQELKQSIKVNPRQFYLRDGVLWKIVGSENRLYLTKAYFDHRYDMKVKFYAYGSLGNKQQLLFCGLLDLDSSIEQWKCSIREGYNQLVKDAMYESMVQDLLRQLQNDEQHNRSSDSDETHKIVNRKVGNQLQCSRVGNKPFGTNGNPRRRKKSSIATLRNSKVIERSSKNQNVKIVNSSKLVGDTQQHQNLLLTNDMHGEIESCDEKNTIVESYEGDLSLPVASDGEEIIAARFEYPKSMVSPRDRNRNIVIACTILDEVLSNVFQMIDVCGNGYDQKSSVCHNDKQTDSDSFEVIHSKAKYLDSSSFSCQPENVPPMSRNSTSAVIHVSPSPIKSLNSGILSNSTDISASISSPTSPDQTNECKNMFVSNQDTQCDVDKINIDTFVPVDDVMLEDQIMSTNTMQGNSVSTTNHNSQERFQGVIECSKRSTGPAFILQDWQVSQQKIQDSCVTIRRSNVDYSMSAVCPDGMSINPWGQDSLLLPSNLFYGGIANKDDGILTTCFQTQSHQEFSFSSKDEYNMASSTTAYVSSTAKLDETIILGDHEIHDQGTEVVAWSIEETMDRSCNRYVISNELDQPMYYPESNPSSGMLTGNRSLTVGLLEQQTQPPIEIPKWTERVASSFVHESTPTVSQLHATQNSTSTFSSTPSIVAPNPSPTFISPVEHSTSRKDIMNESLSLNKSNNLPVNSLKSGTISNVANLSSGDSPFQEKLVSTVSREDLFTSLSDGKVPSRARENKKTRINSPDSIKTSDFVSSKTAGAIILYSDKSRDDDDVKFRGTSALRRPLDTLSSYRHSTKRTGICKDDQDIGTDVNRDFQMRCFSSRGLVVKGSTQLHHSWSSNKSTSGEPTKITTRPFNFESVSVVPQDKDFSTRSETALEEEREYQVWSQKFQPNEDVQDTNTVTKDGSTTISSAQSPKETEEICILREERNSYRDMCLTLGAEVAKLKNMLAAQKNTSHRHSTDFPNGYGIFPSRNNFVFDPESVSHHAFRIAPRARTLAAMSDAGCGVDHESLVSEDEANRFIVGESLQMQPSTVTLTGSDTSLDHTSSQNASQVPFIGFRLTRDGPDPVSLNGMQSRLTKDIFQFLETINLQLRKMDTRRQTAVDRMTRLVKTLWPRAQAKLYGSHVTGLCLPSSDLDFVVCLPAVHKNTMAIAAGELEVRTAINESSQKLLARRLKGESWIDPRSMKLIERTVVPVIKVSTKDTKARTLQLDITFDSPAHHGIEAVEMVTRIMNELPMIRPIIVVLKQFLSDRGLLTAYTGGLSSYCLLLMVTRYLQEQPSSWGDCGALLMGFLDFYGNCFDPRTTGISVRNQMYFERPNYAALRHHTTAQAIWNPVQHVQERRSVCEILHPSTRRNSFSDKASTDGIRSGQIRLPSQQQFPSSSSLLQNTFCHQPSIESTVPLPDQNIIDHRLPFTFDPLFVEDPLSETNNVGRNAFRIFQVQRAFSDAHRALVAALEWDMQSTGEMEESSEYPLLKCLLQKEDVVFDL